MTQRLEGGGGSGRAKGGRWKVPGRANRPCTERRNGIQWPEAGGPVRASLGLKMMERRNNVIQLLKYSISDLRDGSEGKESAFIAGDTGGKSSIPGSGDPLEKEMAAHSSILAWEIPWTEEPGSLWGYSLWGCKESYVTERLNIHKHTHTLCFKPIL